MAGLLGNLKNPFGSGGLLSDPMVRLQMGAAMMGGRTLGEQFGGGLQAAGVAGQARQQKMAEQEKINQTLKFLQGSDPELAQAVEAGVLDPASAYKMHIESQKPKHPEFQDRASVAEQYGIDPNSPEGRRFILTGNLPEQTAPKAPEMQTLYDERGAEYKAQWMPQSQTWERIGGSKAGSNGITITNPDGTTTQIGGTGGKTTEADRRAGLLAGQMQGSAKDALANFDTLATARNTGGAAGGKLGRAIMDPKAQVAKDAVRNVVANWLYLTSGATASPEELQNQVEMLTPTAFDDDLAVAAKRERLQSIVNEMNKRGGISTGAAPDPANIRKTQSGISFSAGQ